MTVDSEKLIEWLKGQRYIYYKMESIMYMEKLWILQNNLKMNINGNLVETE